MRGNSSAKLTLVPPQTPTCRFCGPVDPSAPHAKTCPRNQPYRTGRHEIVEYALARALKAMPGCHVETEPLIHHRNPRSGSVYSDVRFTGSLNSGMAPMDFGIKVTGINTACFDV